MEITTGFDWIQFLLLQKISCDLYPQKGQVEHFSSTDPFFTTCNLGREAAGQRLAADEGRHARLSRHPRLLGRRPA